MPLYPAPVIPWFLGDLADIANGQANTRTANTCYFSPIVLLAPVSVLSATMQFGTGGNGNYDQGIYDGQGNLLAHIGSRATSTGVVTVALGSPLSLSPGRYYLAFWTDNALDTSYSSNGTTAGAWPALAGGGASLPAQMSSIAPTSFHRRISQFWHVQGGF
jgi:hypothetical protein